MGTDGVHSDSRHVVKSLGQAGRSDVIGRSGLKFQGRTFKCALLKTYVLNHLSTSLIRRKAVEPLLFSVQRSEEHTSELQSRQYLVCRLLLEKKTRTE